MTTSPRDHASSDALYLPLLYENLKDSVNTSITPGISHGSISSPIEQKSEGSTVLQAIILLCNAILGAGLLGQAYAVSAAGIAVYTVLLLCVAIAAWVSLKLLIEGIHAAGVTSYEELGSAAMGQAGGRLAAAAIMLQNLGSTTGYAIILGDIVPNLLQSYTSGWWVQRTPVIIGMMVIVVWPLVCLKSISALSYGSGLSVVAMVVLTVVSVVYAAGPTQCTGCDADWVPASVGTFATVFPTIGFSYVCHTAFPNIYHELRDRRPVTMMKVATGALSLTTVLYLTAGLAGYWLFRSQVDADVVKSLEAAYSHANTVLMLRILTSIGTCVTIPLILFPFRKAVERTWWPQAEFSWPRHLAIGTGSVACITALAVTLPNIKAVFAYAGSTSTVALVFILPGYFYRRITHSKGMASPLQRVALGIMVLGVIAGAGSLAGTIYDQTQ